MLTNRQKGLIYGAFIGDALALGPHWIYDTDLIEQQFAPLTDFMEPATPYHSIKGAGDFTHYGDQSLMLLKHLASYRRFDLANFKEDWINFIKYNTLYLDHATKTSLDILTRGDGFIGSDSMELGGLVRSGPLFALTHVTVDELLAQTHLTHNNETLDAIVLFTYRLLKYVLSGKTPSEALDLVYPESSDIIKAYVDQALANIDQPPVPTIKAIGQSCSAEFGLPASIYLILKYENDFVEALVQNAYAGGDSAARGMYIGMVLGAYMGYDKLPSKWIEDLNAKDTIKEALSVFE